MRIFIYIFFATLVAYSCSQQIDSRLASQPDWKILPPLATSHDCKLASNYTPDSTHYDFWPIKYVRLNHHVLDRSKDPVSFSADKGPGQMQGIVDISNIWLSRAPRPSLPADNRPARIYSRMRFVTSPDPDDPNDTGFYFHYDSDVPWHVHTGRNQNISNYDSYTQFATRKDSILNVMYLSHHPDSMASKTYKKDGSGVALGRKWVKLVNDWGAFVNPWPHHINMMHEIGHVYSLNHSWYGNDGCDDTPQHPNCWNETVGPGCEHISNNVMDYTAAAITFTPCQVGRMQELMAREGGTQRKFLEPNWCMGKAGVTAELRDTFVLGHATDLESDLVLYPGAYLQVKCRLSIPAGKRIILHPGATLDMAGGKLHNSCGLKWAGIEMQQVGRKKGKLIWRAGSEISDTDQLMGPKVKL